MTQPNGKRNVALKLSEDVYAQLMILAQLRSTTIPDEIRAAITPYLTSQRTAMSEHAVKLRADIERRATQDLALLDSLFGGEDGAAEAEAPKGRGGRRHSEAAAD
jgi:hypothetical protein